MIAQVITVDVNVVVILAGQFLDITLLNVGGFPRRLWSDEVRKHLEIHLDKISRIVQSMDIIDQVLSC